MNHPLIFVLCDSIFNPVFSGQVLEPLIARRKKGQPLVLVSFERSPENALKNESTVFDRTKLKEEDQIIYLKRLPFLGNLGLWYEIWQLKKIVKTYTAYELIARGPLAGYIAHKAYDASRCSSFTIQARGLLAEEYRYAHHTNRHNPVAYLHRYRAHLLERIEKKTYALPAITIEAVTDTLGKHLQQQYGARTYTIAAHDTPPTISPEQCARWRHEIRAQLGIPEQAYVYCYSGSLKAWQCPDLVMSFFKQAYEQNKNSFLLLLTQDFQKAHDYAQQNNLHATSYLILTVNHADIYTYLAACDAGLLFRKPSIINWVSRPTKALEYRAVHLSIIHNNTIAELCEKNF